jgi:hypothetical protein
LAESTDLHT